MNTYLTYLYITAQEGSDDTYNNYESYNNSEGDDSTLHSHVTKIDEEVQVENNVATMPTPK